MNERDTVCDQCDHLSECIENGYVLNNTWSHNSRPHYIRGMGAIDHCITLKEEMKKYEKNFSSSGYAE